MFLTAVKVHYDPLVDEMQDIFFFLVSDFALKNLGNGSNFAQMSDGSKARACFGSVCCLPVHTPSPCLRTKWKSSRVTSGPSVRFHYTYSSADTWQTQKDAERLDSSSAGLLREGSADFKNGKFCICGELKNNNPFTDAEQTLKINEHKH